METTGPWDKKLYKYLLYTPYHTTQHNYHNRIQDFTSIKALYGAIMKIWNIENQNKSKLKSKSKKGFNKQSKADTPEIPFQ